MIKSSDLTGLVASQEENLRNADAGFERQALAFLPGNLKKHALIISGIRRCGKSTLLHQFLNRQTANTLYLNFDVPALYNFELNDFKLLDEIIHKRRAAYLFFDEIQVIKGWELFIRQKLDENHRVFVTGSNASLLSRELGTKLTGRHISKELYPFSYGEFCKYRNLSKNKESLNKYLESGGFPEYIKTENHEILSTLVNDILYRDIAVRHNIRDISSLKQLLIFLASNVSNLVSATRIKKFLHIKSTATVLDYFSFFELAYLVYFVPKFSYSQKVQLVNPRKVYFIDNGLLNEITASFNKDYGRKLENFILTELRMRGYELYYYHENGKECDFVVIKKRTPFQLIQVCHVLNHENENREIEGLLDAMRFFDLQEGFIITINQHDTIIFKDKKINIVPAYTFISGNGYME